MATLPRLRMAAGLCLLLTHPALAKDISIAAPAGGAALLLPGQRVVCPQQTNGDADAANDAELGWRVDASGRKLVPGKTVGAHASFEVAASIAACATERETLTATSVAAWPQIADDGVVAYLDTGRVEVRGASLKDIVLHWRQGERTGSDICREPDIKQAQQQCTFAIPSDFTADLTGLSLTIAPEGVHGGADAFGYDNKGRRLPMASLQRQPSKIVLREFLAAETTLDAANEEARIPLRHAEAIAQVSCMDAVCEWTGSEVLVRGLRGNDEALELRVQLRPHVYYQGNKELSQTAAFWVPLQRCPLSLASALPFRSVGSQKVVLKVGGRCAEDDSLRFFVNGNSAAVIDHVSANASRYVVLALDSNLGDEISITLQHRNRVVALSRSKTRQMPNVHARLELSGHGAIDFLPTNRDADLLLPSLGESSQLLPLPVSGVYSVTTTPGSNARVRGVIGATGWVALRFAVRDTSLPGPLAQLNLLQFSETVDRSIHSASLPLSLGASALSDKPIVELLCSDAQGVPRVLPPAKPISLDYVGKDSCRLVLHRERLLPEEGEQLLRITVNVAALDGVNRPEAAIDQRVRLSPGRDPKVLYIGGVLAPFDRVVVRATVVTEDLPDAVITERFTDRLTLPQVQWSLIMGNNKLRLFATTAMPTGLFRVAGEKHSGLVGLSAGILVRLVWLTRMGVQAPIGIEGGVLVLGIAGDTTPAPHGQFAAVLGLSLGVPIANVSRTTQAAISLHAWAEYEISRVFIKNAGSPWGFVFGPSLSFGDVGLNL